MGKRLTGIVFFLLFLFLEIAAGANRSISLNQLGLRISSKGECIISSEINLKGNTFVVPSGTTLHFLRKGRIKNGTIYGNNTRIEWHNNSIFNKVCIAGTWIVPEIYTGMFRDCESMNCIKNVFALSSSGTHNRIHIGKGRYPVSVPKSGKTCIKVYSNTDIILDGHIILEANSFPAYNLFKLDGDNIYIYGSGSIVGDKDKHLGIKGEWGHGLNVGNGNNIRIEGITIKDFWGDCIYVRGKNNVLVSKCKILNGRRQGISVTQCKNIIIRNCYFEKVGGTSPGYAIDIEPNKGDLIETVLIEGNNVVGCAGGIRVTGPKSNPVMNAIVRDCVVSKTVRNPYAFYNTKYLELDNCIGKQCSKPMKFVKVKELVIGENKMIGLSSPFQMSGCNNIKRIKR